MAYIGREPLGGEVILLNSIESQFNGVLTTFNLTRTVSGVTSAFYPVGSEQLLVSLGGVIQRPDTTGDTGFRISFNTIIFAVAPTAGTSCFIVAYGNVTDIGAPANNTVSTDKLVNGAVTPAKLSTGGPWWLSNGNVGIGTTNPGYTLDVQGSQNVTTQISLWGRTIGQPQTLIEPGKIYATAAGLGPGNLLLQPTGGNIGIGTDSPSQILHVHAPGTDLAVIRLSGTANLQTPYNIRQGITGVSNAGFSIFDVTSATTRFAIDSAGNIGIGTGNPVSILHVESATPGVTLNTTANNGTTSITFNETGSNAARLSVSGDYLDSIIELENYSALWASTGLVIRGNNVGIGITTPQNVLDLGSATNNRGISWGGTGANYANIWTEYSTASIHIGQGVRPIGTSTGWVSSTGISSVGRSVIKLNFNTGDIGFHTTTPVTVADGSAVTVDQRMVIAGTGNVGIGTTNPSTRLHLHTTAGWGGNITGSSLIRLESTDTVGPAIAFKNSSGSYWNIYHGSTDSFVGNNNLGFMYTDGVIAGGINNVRVTFTSSGNVGIGTTTPFSTLEVRKGGTNTVSGSLFGGGFTQSIVSGESQLCLISNIDSSGNFGSTEVARGGIGFSWANVNDRTRFIVGTQSNHPLRLFTNNLERVRVNESGNVGIGTTDPSDKLHVNGSIRAISYGSVGNYSALLGQIRVGADQYGNTIKVVNDTNLNIVANNNIYFNTGAATDGSTSGAYVGYFGPNGLYMAPGKGIDFSANPNPSGMTSELLNDYEEGTWTPVWESTGALPTLSYMTQSGYYVKIGRVVHFWGRIYMNSWGGGGGSGNIRVGGLPFTSNSDSNHGGPLCQITFSYGGGSNAVWPSGASQVFARVLNGSTSIEYISLGVPTTALGEGGILQWTSNPQMYNNYFSGSYFV